VDLPLPLHVTVVTGFLGAGKTTLVNHWLGGFAPGDVAVIVNEHGAVGIDGELLAARVRELVEITGGCVCCKTQNELVRALGDLASSAHRPKRILVETSGAASPAGVLRAITGSGRASGRFALDGVVTVVDATRLDVVSEHDLAREQIGYADVVVLSRADRCSPDGRRSAMERISAYNGAALVVFAARGEVEPAAGLDALLELRQRALSEMREVREVPPAGAEHVYESVALTLDGELDGERFADFMEGDLAQISGRLFRIKGILAVAGVDERMIVQGVGEDVEVTFGAPWSDGLDREALARAFTACGRSKDEAGQPAGGERSSSG
jgi:G3E family GTPase